MLVKGSCICYISVISPLVLHYSNMYINSPSAVKGLKVWSQDGLRTNRSSVTQMCTILKKKYSFYLSKITFSIFNHEMRVVSINTVTVYKCISVSNQWLTRDLGLGVVYLAAGCLLTPFLQFAIGLHLFGTRFIYYCLLSNTEGLSKQLHNYII